MMHRAVVVSSLSLALALALTGCDSTTEAVKSGKEVAASAVDASKGALDGSKKAAGDAVDSAVDASKKTAGEIVDATKTGARALFHDLRDDGELSDSSKAWLSTQASSNDATIEAVVVKGVQLAPVAVEATKVLVEATDTETAIEPIFQKVDGDTTKTDAAIKGMPRVEVIDGLTIGFKQMDSLDASKKVEQRGYLVMWRHEDHLVGFVYRSTRTIDLEKLVAETPRLAKMTQQALKD